MANLQIKGIEDNLYAEIKALAAAENRSVSQEMLFLVKEYLVRKKHLSRRRTPAQALLDLSGSWQDERSPDEIISAIKKARKNSKKILEGI